MVHIFFAVNVRILWWMGWSAQIRTNCWTPRDSFQKIFANFMKVCFGVLQYLLRVCGPHERKSNLNVILPVSLFHPMDINSGKIYLTLHNRTQPCTRGLKCYDSCVNMMVIYETWYVWYTMNLFWECWPEWIKTFQHKILFSECTNDSSVMASYEFQANVMSYKAIMAQSLDINLVVIMTIRGN